MTASSIAIDAALAVVTASCCLGALGAWRMRKPMQALHYLALPAGVGAAAMVLAVGLQTGQAAATFKALLIALILAGTNSIVTHATARAFRSRALGHWEPRPEDHLALDGAGPSAPSARVPLLLAPTRGPRKPQAGAAPPESHA